MTRKAAFKKFEREARSAHIIGKNMIKAGKEAARK